MSHIIELLRMGDIVSILIYLLSIALTMMISLSFHECAHAYVAYKLGDPTAKNLGRVSLDPIRHIDPLGAICFLICGIGWAKPVPINHRNLKNFRRDDVLIALAGPFTNLILSFVFFGIWFFVGRVTDNYIIMTVLWDLWWTNLCLTFFNLLPIAPLDGFHVISSLLIKRAYKFVDIMYRYGRYLLIAVLLSDVFGNLMQLIYGWIVPLYYNFFSLFV